MNINKIKELEELATKLTGICPINDREYQRLTYERNNKNLIVQKRKEFFKAKKRII